MSKQLGIVEHCIYFQRNLFAWEVFHLKQQRFVHLPRFLLMNALLYLVRSVWQWVLNLLGTKLLVFGREVYGFAIWKYSILTNSWSKTPSMNQPRCSFGSGSSKEMAIAAGGCDTRGVVLKSAELYNSELGTCEMLTDMHSRRKLCSGFFMDAKFYVIGDMISDTESLTCGEGYNLETRT
ncbi:hypothetical protein SUGI_0863420 [Cryptomeria japonica]|nr:hypothetical protein SUGI_0863420 [Cryptomeria japonica]